jgi:hypothetical protein
VASGLIGPLAPVAGDWDSPARRTLTSDQLAAARAAMDLVREDDLARGVSPLLHRRCDGCQRWRSAPGFVQYESVYLCHACATGYELARLRGVARTPAAYLAAHARPGSAI